MSWLVKQLNKKQKGFTLIEMVVVLAIIAVLIAIAVPQVLRQINNAKKNADIANAKTIATAIQQWVAEGNTLMSGNWAGVTETNPVSTGLTKYVSGGLPKVRYNSSWGFSYRYDAASETVYVGVYDTASHYYQLYPTVSDEAQSNSGATVSGTPSPYKQ